MKDFLLIIIPAIAGFIAAWFCRRHDYEAGRIDGANEERSYQNARNQTAWSDGHASGVRFGCENHEALMSRRKGNVSGRPISKLN